MKVLEKITAFVNENAKGVRTADICAHTKFSKDQVYQAMYLLKKKGKVKTKGVGLYFPANNKTTMKGKAPKKISIMKTVTPGDIPDVAAQYAMLKVKRDWYTGAIEALEKAVQTHLT